MTKNTDKLKNILNAAKEQDVNVDELQEVPDSVINDVISMPTPTQNSVPSVAVVTSGKEIDIEEDYNYIRSNLRNLIDKGTDALDSMIMIAEGSEKAFAFGTVATLMKTLVETNKELIQLQQTMNDLKTEEEKDRFNKDKPTTTNIENAVFVGSTAELNKMIREKQKKPDDDDELF